MITMNRKYGQSRRNIRTGYDEQTARIKCGKSDLSYSVRMTYRVLHSGHFLNKRSFKLIRHVIDRKLLTAHESLGIIKINN